MSSYYLSLGTIALLICHFHIASSTASLNRDNLNVPCSFLDSLNITNGQYDPKTKSIQYDNQTFLPGQYGSFDYEVSFEKRMPAPKHYRACVCKNKPCISLCCPLGQTLLLSVNDTFVCTPNQHPDKYQMMMDVLDPALNTTTEENVLSRFGYLVSPKCERYVLDPEENPLLDVFHVMTVRMSKLS